VEKSAGTKGERERTRGIPGIASLSPGYGAMTLRSLRPPSLGHRWRDLSSGESTIARCRSVSSVTPATAPSRSRSPSGAVSDDSRSAPSSIAGSLPHSDGSKSMQTTGTSMYFGTMKRAATGRSPRTGAQQARCHDDSSQRVVRRREVGYEQLRVIVSERIRCHCSIARLVLACEARYRAHDETDTIVIEQSGLGLDRLQRTACQSAPGCDLDDG